jgi:septal ring-binding cell division protein DamX
MLEGEIRDIDLVARLIELWREQFTGAIRFEHDGIIKIIYFKGGDVLSASTNDRADSVDEILMRAGKVSREHVKQALAKRKENETLGDTLLNLGFITRKELTWARRVQVVGVIRSIEAWGAGSYTIVADYLPKRDEGTIFSLPQIIVELVVTDQDRPKFEKLLESGSAVFTKAPAFDEQFAKFGFNEDAEAVVKEVDGERTAAEVAASSGHDTFNAYKLLHALSLLGLLTQTSSAAPALAPEPVVQQPPQLEPTGFDGIGAVSDAADAWSSPPSPSMPQFDLDDVPGQETTPLGTSSPSSFSFDAEPEPASVAAPAAPAAMPGWDAAPRGASPASAPAPEPPAEPAEEPQWGFDEAQIDTVRKASVPVAAVSSRPAAAPVATPAPKRDYSASMSTTRRPAPPRAKTVVKKKKRSYFGLIFTLMVVFILAAGGYYGFTWYTAKIANAPDIAVKKPVAKAPAPVVQPTATATVAPPAVKPAPPVTATTAAPPPTRVAPPAAKPSPDRDRYAAMAREFAAAPGAKFTVQFEIVCETSNIARALATGGTNVWFVPISLKGRSCYRVFWGRYQTRDAAERAVNDVPASLREAKPAVVQVPQP